MSTFRNVPGQLNTPIDNKLPRDQKLAVLAGILGQVASSIDPDGAAGRIGAAVTQGSQGIVQSNILQREQQYMDAPQRPVNPGGQQFGGFGGLLPQNAQAGPSQLPAAGQPYQQQLAEGSFGGMGAIAPQVAQDTLQRQQQTGSGQQRTGGGSRQQQASSFVEQLPDGSVQFNVGGIQDRAGAVRLPRISAAEAMILGPQGVAQTTDTLREMQLQRDTILKEIDDARFQFQTMLLGQQHALGRIDAGAQADIAVSEETGRTAINEGQAESIASENAVLTPENRLRQFEANLAATEAGTQRTQQLMAADQMQQQESMGITTEEQRFIENAFKTVGLGDEEFAALMAGGTERLQVLSQLPDEMRNRLHEQLLRGQINGAIRPHIVDSFNPSITFGHRFNFSSMELRQPEVLKAFRDQFPDGAVVELSDGTLVRKTARGVMPVQ